jgi:endoglucanase Acf2
MKRFTLAVIVAAVLRAAPVGAADGAAAPPGAGVVRVGSGGYVTAPPPPGAKGPQAEVWRAPGLRGPMPTNDWWSSLAWVRYSERQYPHPLAVRAQADGLRVWAPKAITANDAGVFGFMPERGGDDLVIGTAGAAGPEPFADARVESFSDWFVTARLGQAGRGVSASYGHGSPFVYALYDEGGAARVTFARPPQVWAGGGESATLGVSVDGKPYGLFAPGGSAWAGVGTNVLTSRPAGGRRHFSVAALPDASEKTLALFARYAHAHVTDTKVAWRYDPKSAAVTTTFAYTVKAYEGDARGTLFALYPHQWRHAQGAPLVDGLGYDSVRGRMKLAEGTFFSTEVKFPGVLPSLPVAADADRARLAGMLKAEAAAPEPPMKDTYWDGKHLGRLATLVPLAEQLREPAAADALRGRVRARLERWLNPREAGAAGGNPRTSNVFHYDRNWGTLIGYPASFGSDVELNDHHFHYGYFLKAAAEIARHDPAWAADERWGGMLRLLIRDVASTDRADPLFPFLRNFDPYAGHTWASGHAKFGDGNNNESSSEAMNAWCGLILLGQAIGDPATRDLGVWLYTTEMTAIHEYWFDVRDENHPPAYAPAVVTMVWGGKGANGTWFSNKPPVVHGINFLPIHGGSLYLGLYPDYARRNYEDLVRRNKGDRFAEWADIAWMYRALSDPADAARLMDAAGEKYPAEGGNSRANTYHWITALRTLGRVDGGVTADHPLSATFVKDGVRTYTAWNVSDKPLTVRFSDGFVLESVGKGPTTGKR